MSSRQPNGNLVLQTKSISSCPPTEKGQRIEQLFSQLLVYQEPLSPKSKHLMGHTHTQKVSFSLFLKIIHFDPCEI